VAGRSGLIVITEIDGFSSHVDASRLAIEDVLASPDVEAIEVKLDTHMDPRSTLRGGADTGRLFALRYAVQTMRIFSGIQPTGRKHLGNYLGAIRQYVAGQDRGEAIYCIVDLHAITVAYEPEELSRTILDTTALLMAAGIDPDHCILFRQSEVKEHTELCWLLTTVTAYGELARMHQFKEKSEQQRDFVSAGLFVYPILQAADILAYQTDEVPVGEDQKQHLELARDIAQRFNARYGETFVVPEHRIHQVAARVMDLQAPEKKMSTTGGTELGTVLVLDEPAEIRLKFKAAVTDSGRDIVRRQDKAGVTNLIQIMAAARGIDAEQVEKEYAEAPGYEGFKQDVDEAVVELLAPVRERYAELRPDEGKLGEVLASGGEKARAIASETLELVRWRMGIGPHRLTRTARDR
jgi:tryptophanyl-tRNA synthetase